MVEFEVNIQLEYLQQYTNPKYVTLFYLKFGDGIGVPRSLGLSDRAEVTDPEAAHSVLSFCIYCSCSNQQVTSVHA